MVFVHRNPPDKTLRISLSDGNSVVCSIYRFWRANLGWAQAPSVLKPGDTLRHFGGIVHVEDIATDTFAPVLVCIPPLIRFK